MGCEGRRLVLRLRPCPPVAHRNGGQLFASALDWQSFPFRFVLHLHQRLRLSRVCNVWCGAGLLLHPCGHRCGQQARALHHAAPQGGQLPVLLRERLLALLPLALEACAQAAELLEAGLELLAIAAELLAIFAELLLVQRALRPQLRDLALHAGVQGRDLRLAGLEALLQAAAEAVVLPLRPLALEDVLDDAVVRCGAADEEAGLVSGSPPGGCDGAHVALVPRDAGEAEGHA
mmetsp:Transcript_15908/g.50929  ORF Transcript_15908/g.50929 Transcript_15908/m.50929 type:complete len:233 (-) Transcript_15908:92-790(-)